MNSYTEIAPNDNHKFKIFGKILEGDDRLLDYRIESTCSCEFCGRKRQRRGFVVPNNKIHWCGYEECSCTESVENRSKLVEVDNFNYSSKGGRLIRFQRYIHAWPFKRYSSVSANNLVVNSFNFSVIDSLKQYVINWENFYKDSDAVKGILLQGQTGVGKTHLCAFVRNELIKNGIPVVMTSFVDFFSSAKKSFGAKMGQNDDVYNKMLDDLESVDLLIIDDFGKEKYTNWVLEQIFCVINSRYNNNLPLLINTNYTLDDIKLKMIREAKVDEMYALSILERIYEMTFTIILDGINFRFRRVQ